MSLRVKLGLAGLILVVQFPLLHQLFWTPPEPTATAPFEDAFERSELGPNYETFFHAALPKIEDGRLNTGPLMNNPLWLKLKLPEDVAISFDVQAKSPTADIKWECFGNGRDHQSGYVFIFGGWKNTVSVLARLDEHGVDRKEKRGLRVDPALVYRMRVTRRSGHIQWFVNEALFLEWDDQHPLKGSEHNRFGFSAWETPTLYDNLRIEAL